MRSLVVWADSSYKRSGSGTLGWLSYACLVIKSARVKDTWALFGSDTQVSAAERSAARLSGLALLKPAWIREWPMARSSIRVLAS